MPSTLYIKLAATAIVFALISFGVYKVNSVFEDNKSLSAKNNDLEIKNAELKAIQIRTESDFNNTMKIVTDSIQQQAQTNQKIKVVTNTIEHEKVIYVKTPVSRTNDTKNMLTY
jgi:hypothetical protein